MSRDPSPFARNPALGWITAGLLGLLLVIVFHQGSLYRPILDQSTADLAALGEVRELILERWVEEPDRDSLRDGALDGMAKRLDPFSDYISPAELQAFETRTTGKFGGLGVWITIEEGLVVVIAPIEDTPAWEAGIMPGDAILRIDGEALPEFSSTTEAVDMLKGEPGTEVTLTVLHRDSQTVAEYTLERAIIQIKTVKGTRLLEDKVGYTRITAFNAGTVDEFAEATIKLRELGYDSLVLDLRGNPGGYLHGAAAVGDAFLESGKVIVVTRARSGEIEQKLEAELERRVAVPVAVLVDGGSASASEILAGALQDNGVATVVGMRSYGKGSVQSLLDILGGTAQLKLTTQYFFTPGGRRIHRGDRGPEDLSWGIVPDIEVAITSELRRDLSRAESDREMERLKVTAGQEGELPPEQLHVEDPQVKAAFEHLQRVLAGESKLGEKRSVEGPAGDVAPIDSTATAQASPEPTDSPPQGE